MQERKHAYLPGNGTMADVQGPVLWRLREFIQATVKRRYR